MALTLQTVSTQARNLRHIIASHPYAIGLSALTIFLARAISKEYAAWLGIEAGGLPHNFFGYIIAKVIGTQKSADLLSTTLYTKLMDSPVKSKQYIPDLPIRTGPAPIVSEWAVPVRQLSSHAERMHVKALDSVIASTTASFPKDTLRAPSKQEGGKCDALWVMASPVATNPNTSTSGRNGPEKMELYHFHDFDGSAHATLSPADAKYLLDRGWGIRHPLSGQMLFGIGMLLPANYVMIYAPRNEEEIRVHEIVAKAAVEFALEGRRR